MVRNSERWEYGMGLAYTSLPLWLSATLQGAGREGQKTEKKKIVGSGVLKLLVLTRNTMLLCRTFLRGLERIRVRSDNENYVWAVRKTAAVKKRWNHHINPALAIGPVDIGHS